MSWPGGSSRQRRGDESAPRAKTSPQVAAPHRRCRQERPALPSARASRSWSSSGERGGEARRRADRTPASGGERICSALVEEQAPGLASCLKGVRATAHACGLWF